MRCTSAAGRAPASTRRLRAGGARSTRAAIRRAGSAAPTPPTAEGGALRSRTSGRRAIPSPSTAPSSGSTPRPARAARQPAPSSADPNARRIVAQRVPQPVPVHARPGTNELWVGDVGWGTWEEINRVASRRTDRSTTSVALLRGRRRQSGIRHGELAHLRGPVRAGSGAVANPYSATPRRRVVTGEACRTAGPRSPVSPSSRRRHLSGLYRRRALLRRLQPGLHLGIRAPTACRTSPGFARSSGAAEPVELQIGPDGDLYYVDIGGDDPPHRLPDDAPPPIAVVTRQSGDGPRHSPCSSTAPTRAIPAAAPLDLRVGPRQRRRVRRLDHRDTDIHVLVAGTTSRLASRVTDTERLDRQSTRSRSSAGNTRPTA